MKKVGNYVLLLMLTLVITVPMSAQRGGNDLNLTENQRAQLAQLKTESRMEKQRMKGEKALHRKEMQDRKQAKLRSILTPEQYGKYLAKREHKMKKQAHKHRKGNGKGNGNFRQQRAVNRF